MAYNLNNNKRIAKNALMLSLRMFFSMTVSLYTSRVVLRVLQFDDYGIYNVVGGVIVLFTFMNSAMAGATQRYLTFDIGRNDKERLKRVFRTSLQIHILIALAILVLGETVGLWFVMHELVIPPDRMNAAFWVYQFSVLSCMVSVVSIPFNADIIAHERMNVFAYISIADVVLKLLIVYLLVIAPFDKLIFYAFLVLCVQLLIQLIYDVYCRTHFDEVGFTFKVDRQLFREMSGFAGWSLCGNAAYILYTEGVNIVLNLFFGPAINTARGIAVQVQGAISGFVSNVQMAVNPQITKSYAQGNLNRMHSLMFGSSKICFFLLFFIVLPLGIEGGIVLETWLGRVPEHTLWFLRLVLVVMLIETLANPYAVANQATGKIKLYQAVCGGILLCIVPVSYVVLRCGGSPESVYVVYIAMALLAQLARIFIMRKLIDVPFHYYFHKVLVPVILVSSVSPIVPIIIYVCTPVNVVTFFVVCAVSVVTTSLSVWFLGLTVEERDFVRIVLRKRLGRYIDPVRVFTRKLCNTIYYIIRCKGRILFVNCFIEQWFGKLSQDNFGDELNVYLLEELTGKKVVNINAVCLPFVKNYIVIGSVIENFTRKNTIIWGGGTIDGSHLPLSNHPQRVCAVRGQLTRQYLMDRGIECPPIYGDPALLMPLVYDPDIVKKYRIGIIPHVEDLNSPFIQQLKSNCPDDVLIISFRNYGDWHCVIDQIKSCEFIFSSSLHGLILADAYCVPNIWIKLSDNIIGGEYKFRDYFSSVGRHETIPVEVNESTSLQALTDEKVKRTEAVIDVKPLIDACPFRLNIKK